jgi:hypothetical protein
VNALLLSVLLLQGSASAASWTDLAEIFPALPCQDGWAGCVVDGEQLGPDMVQGAEGIPVPSTMRLDWFSLEGTANLSPFVGLSDYPTALAQVAPREPTPRPQQAEPEPREVAQAGPAARPPDRTGPARDDLRPLPAIPDRSHDAVADVSPEPTSTYEPEPVAVEPASVGPRLPPAQILPAGTTHQDVQPAQVPEPVVVQPEPEPEPEPVRPEPEPEPAQPEPVSNDAVVDVAPVVEIDDSCDDLVALEPAALMGQLSPGQSECLEARIVSTSRMTEKDKVSRVLIMDAETKGNRPQWERLMKRHLEEIDRSDPDLCFKYAIYLSRKGVGRAHGVIRWADYALENKSKWSGSTFVSRVYALLKLKAEGANRIWQAAEEAYVADRSDENEAKAQKYRDLTKVYSREWLDYARASGQDIKNAMALCVSAAGNRTYCEGG